MSVLAFGPFRLDTETRLLFRGTEPTPLGQRAVALMHRLLAEAGRPVSKEALISAAWGGLAVEDSNLTVQIAALRRVLEEASPGARWIETLPRRGYRYAGPAVTHGEGEAPVAPARTERPTVAVLGFANLGGDATQDYFIHGMVDDIATGLARVKWLFVIGHNTARRYQADDASEAGVGRKLGVRYVLGGSVRKEASQMRIAAHLTDTETGARIWGERYDRNAGDVFALQDEIALAVVGAIEPSLRRAEAERVRRKRPDNLAAYDLVLRAQADVYSGMPVRIATALPLLERALALEPDYALAHAYAAMSHHCLYLRDGLGAENLAASIRHARAAIAHGHDDALALTFAGFSLGMDAHDRDAAFAAFDAALAACPSSALTYILGSVILGWAGEADSAIGWGERGLRLSPFDSWAFAAYHGIALGHFARGEYEAAVRAAHHGVRTNPEHSISHMLLAAALERLGRVKEAHSAAAQVMELQPGFNCATQFRGVNCVSTLAAGLTAALRNVGLAV